MTPTKRTAAVLSEEWREAFNAGRCALLEQLQDIPITSHAIRLKVLDRICTRAEEQGEFVLALNALEPAALEHAAMEVATRSALECSLTECGYGNTCR